MGLRAWFCQLFGPVEDDVVLLLQLVLLFSTQLCQVVIAVHVLKLDVEFHGVSVNVNSPLLQGVEGFICWLLLRWLVDPLSVELTLWLSPDHLRLSSALDFYLVGQARGIGSKFRIGPLGYFGLHSSPHLVVFQWFHSSRPRLPQQRRVPRKIQASFHNFFSFFVYQVGCATRNLGHFRLEAKVGLAHRLQGSHISVTASFDDFLAG